MTNTQEPSQIRTVIGQDQITMNRYFCILADAKLTAKEYPGTFILPSAHIPWAYTVGHRVATDLDKVGVSIEDLQVEVHNLLLELQCRFGKHGERLQDEGLHLALTLPPTEF